MKRLLLIVLAGCAGGAAPAATPANTTTPPAPVADGPPPSVARVGPYQGFTATGLPAVTSDGTSVVIAEQREDGARGEPNLAIVVRDLADTTVHEHVVLDPERAPEPSEARLADANAYLARLHRERGLIPLTRDPDGVRVTWTEPRLAVEAGGAVVVERDLPAWIAPPRGECTNPSHLGEVWGAPGQRFVLLRISYAGTDLCWEPDSAWHVVSW